MQTAVGLSPLAGMLQAVSDKAMAKALQRLNWLKVIDDIPFLIPAIWMAASMAYLVKPRLLRPIVPHPIQPSQAILASVSYNVLAAADI
jgi:hypothetical protein